MAKITKSKTAIAWLVLKQGGFALLILAIILLVYRESGGGIVPVIHRIIFIVVNAHASQLF